MPILTLQGSGKDVDIRFNSTVPSMQNTNYNSNTNMEAFYSTDFGTYRSVSLIQMPLTNLPNNVIINSATFSAYYGDKYNTPTNKVVRMNICRRSDWVESQATYNIYKTGSNWGTAGALNTTNDIDTSTETTSTVPSAYGWMNWDAIDHVKHAYTNSLDFNVILRTTDNHASAVKWFTREYATDTSLRPKLVIEYASAASFIPGIMQHNFIPSFLGGR